MATHTMERVAAPPAAHMALRREARRSWRSAGWIAAGGVAAGLAAYATSWTFLWGVAAAAAVVPSFFLLTANRAYRVRSNLAAGCLRALVVGWTRTPDGCNFAVFPLDADPSTSDPQFVVRLATVRHTSMSNAVIARAKGARAPAAIFTPDGEVIGVGRVRSTSSGLRVWSRRHRPTPWYAMDSGRDSAPRL